MTREQVDVLLGSLGKLGVGTNDGDVVHELWPTQGGALLSLRLLGPSLSNPTLSPLYYPGLNQRQAPGRIQSCQEWGTMMARPRLGLSMIQAASVDCQVSHMFQTGFTTRMVDGIVSRDCVQRTW